ncbi:MAG: aminoglycoside 3'-phosphotransferase [Clostridia bacterium]|nr:aminoglycoside 3'-phosphotransferase [Clostridia bacterium]
MKKTLIKNIPEPLPRDIERIILGAPIYDSSSSSEARVYFIDRDGGYYLKTANGGALKKEAEMTRYLHSLGLGAEVLAYESGERDLLLSSRVVGEDCTHAVYISNPRRLASTVGENLRMLHETDFSGCPVMDRNSDYLATAERNYRTGNYDKTAFPDSFGYRSADEAWAVLEYGRRSLTGHVLLHGDYCLPNIMLDKWRLSGFIDVGCGGVGDRHIDLFWGVWSLWFNLKTNEYRDRFLDAYGRDTVNEDILKTVAAAEVFG